MCKGILSQLAYKTCPIYVSLLPDLSVIDHLTKYLGNTEYGVNCNIKSLMFYILAFPLCTLVYMHMSGGLENPVQKVENGQLA